MSANVNITTINQRSSNPIEVQPALRGSQMNQGGTQSLSTMQASAFVQPPAQATMNWHRRVIKKLDKLDAKLEAILPNFFIQNKLDAIGRQIEGLFSPLSQFNEWLNRSGNGDWYQQLATFLMKLPMRAVRNILQMVYNIIKEILYAAVHPIKALNKVAKLLITFVNELTKPETWSKIGIGMIGGSLGQALITGNPLSVIGIGIGVALLITGLSVGALKAAIEAKTGCRLDAAKQNFLRQAKQLPEVMLTGFLMGLLFGAIQRAAENRPARPINDAEARDFANRWEEKGYRWPRWNLYGPPQKVWLDSNGNVAMLFERGHFYENLLDDYNVVISVNPTHYPELCSLVCRPIENVALTHALPVLNGVTVSQA